MKKFLLVFLLFLSLIAIFADYRKEYDDLYRVKFKDNWLFLNEKGDVVIKIPTTDFDDAGNFIEGRGFVSKKIKNIEYDIIGADFYYKIVNLAIINSKNKIIKTFNEPVLILDFDGETNASYIPEFYKGYAKISFVKTDNIKKIKKYSQVKTEDKYVDINGNFVDKNNIPKDIQEMLNKEMFPRERFEYNQNLISKDMKCEQNTDNTCFGYTDKSGNIKIPPVWNADFIGCGDWYAKNQYFYNDRAVAFIQENKREGYLDGYYIFIDTNGKPVNNKKYIYAEPFYRKLTMVVFKNETRAYINTDGNVVWRDY